MGAYGSQLKEVKEVSKNPGDPDWIMSHARASGLEIPETDRLWKRFKVLGADRSGVLRVSADQREIIQAIGDDAFVKNIMRNLKTTNGMTFLTFVNMMKFSQSARLDDKIRAVFHLLNKGSPINEDMLFKVMKHVYAATEEHEDSIKALAKNCIRDMTIGTDNRESVTEEAFVNYMQRFPKSTLEEILTVNIIPTSVRRDIAREQEAQRNKEQYDRKVAERERLVAEMAAAKSARGDGQDASPVDIPQVTPVPRPVPSGKPLTDDLLRQVAHAIPPKADWNLLANRLGFLQRETQALEVNYSESREDMLHAMLKSWRNRGELSSSAPTLHRALAYCRMDAAAKVLSPG